MEVINRESTDPVQPEIGVVAEVNLDPQPDLPNSTPLDLVGAAVVPPQFPAASVREASVASNYNKEIEKATVDFLIPKDSSNKEASQADSGASQTDSEPDLTEPGSIEGVDLIEPSTDSQEPVDGEPQSLYPAIAENNQIIAEQKAEEAAKLEEQGAPLETAIQTNTEAVVANLNDGDNTPPPTEVTFNEDGTIAEAPSIKSFLAAVEQGDKQQALLDELRLYAEGGEAAKEGALYKSLKFLDKLFAPAMFPLAFIEGGLANTPATGSFVGDMISQLDAMGAAGNERLYRWFDPDGGFFPDYASTIVEKTMPWVPEEYRASTGMVLEMAITLPMSFGFASAMQKAIQASRVMNPKNFDGLLKETIYAYLGWRPSTEVMSPETKKLLAQISEGADSSEQMTNLMTQLERAQQGDKGAAAKLFERLGGDPTKPILTTERVVEQVEKVLGTLPSSRVSREFDNQDDISRAIYYRLEDVDSRMPLLDIMDLGDATRAIDERMALFQEAVKDVVGLRPDIPVVPATAAQYMDGAVIKTVDNLPASISDDLVLTHKLDDSGIETIDSVMVNYSSLDQTLSKEARAEQARALARETGVPEDVPVYVYKLDEAGEMKNIKAVRGELPPELDPRGGFKSQSNARTRQLAENANKSLQELFGVPLERMTLTEAKVFELLITDSATEIVDFATMMRDPSLSPFNRDMARAGLAKQLLLHNMMQARVTGFYSESGKRLQSANARLDQLTPELEDMFNKARLKDCD